MADEVKVGDIVQLRAGGPPMRVTSVHTTPGGTVMLGCLPLDASKRQAVEVQAGQVVTIN